jgi:hypothetical protein
MTDDTVRDLLQRSGISFVGTVQQLGAATMNDLPIDDHTAVVVVDQVLHAPSAFASLAGTPVTVQLAEGPTPTVGDQYAFFANALAYGQSLALSEVGRVPAAEIAPHLGLGAAPTGERPIADLAASIEADRLSQHANDADAVVVGTVVGLEKAGPPASSEHDADWWVATIAVHHVEHGDVPQDTVRAAYANSLDVRWRNSPKPKAGQVGMWMLHRSEGPVADFAPFYLPHPDDFQPTQTLDTIRSAGGGS